MACTHEVHGDTGELERGTTLEEEHAVGVWNAEQAAQGGLGVIEDLLVGGRAMAHLQHAHAAAVVVEQLVCTRAQDGLG